MKMKFIFTCLIAATIEFVCPARLTKETSILEHAIAQTVQMVHKREIMKKDIPMHLKIAFSYIDQNNDGHITANEFADYCCTTNSQYVLTYNQWKDAFVQVMGMIDTNGNSQLEINEFQAFAERGGI